MNYIIYIILLNNSSNICLGRIKKSFKGTNKKKKIIVDRKQFASLRMIDVPKPICDQDESLSLVDKLAKEAFTVDCYSDVRSQLDAFLRFLHNSLHKLPINSWLFSKRFNGINFSGSYHSLSHPAGSESKIFFSKQKDYSLIIKKRW